jgi:hypothetical protein
MKQFLVPYSDQIASGRDAARRYRARPVSQKEAGNRPEQVQDFLPDARHREHLHVLYGA